MLQTKNENIRESQQLVILRFLQFGLLIATSLFVYYGVALINAPANSNPSFKATLPLALIFAGSQVFGIRLLRMGYYIQIALTFIWGTFAIIIWVIQVLGLGLYSPIFYLVFVLIVLCGYLLGLRQLIMFSASACLAITCVYFQEAWGWRVTEFPTPRFDLLILILFSIIFCTLATRVTLVELNNRSSELEMIQNHLEEMVQKRSNQLGDALHKAEKANQAKSVFLATMSHELRTPLNAIIGYTEMLEEDLVAGAVTENSLEDAIRIRKSGKHLLGLIKAILDLSKIESGEEELCIEPISAQEIIDQVTVAARPLCHQSDNRLEVGFDVGAGNEGGTISVMADRQKLCQVLLNLVSNANKFTHGGVVTILVARDGGPKSEQISIYVRDTGIGIPEDQISQLFQPFVQLDNAYNRKYEGTGLGLAITSKYCHMMGGEISVRNQDAGGAEFHVTLPVNLN